MGRILAILCIAAAVALPGCGGDDPEPQEGPWTLREALGRAQPYADAQEARIYRGEAWEMTQTYLPPGFPEDLSNPRVEDGLPLDGRSVHWLFFAETPQGDVVYIQVLGPVVSTRLQEGGFFASDPWTSFNLDSDDAMDVVRRLPELETFFRNQGGAAAQYLLGGPPLGSGGNPIWGVKVHAGPSHADEHFVVEVDAVNGCVLDVQGEPYAPGPRPCPDPWD